MRENTAQPQKTMPPDQALHDAGVQYFKDGKIDEAIEAYRRALMHNLDRHDTQFALATCYMHKQAHEKAIDHYQIAGMLAPTHTESWSALATARLNLGRYIEALSAIRQARRHANDPHDAALIKILSMCIAPLEDFDVNPHFVEEVTQCFKTPGVESRKLVHVAQKLLLQQSVVIALLDKHQNRRFQGFEDLLQDQSLQWPVLNHEVFIRVMSDHTLWRDEIETLLHGLRLHFLEMSEAAPLDDAKLWPNALVFIGALAQQCFINEYIYDVSDEEQALLYLLEQRIAKNPNPYDAALLACYKPLNETMFVQSLIDTLSDDQALAPVLKMQILEPWEERDIRQNLTKLTDIDDEISLKVKEQYEAFPYPRWVSTAIQSSCSFRYMLEFKFPQLKEEDLPAEDFRPEVLIAGCGTGRQSNEWSMLIPNSHNVAVDITASSLAYAQRKTHEMGHDNIEYALADILKLGEIDRRFDVIQCGGVLHHMRDPMEGWKILTDILHPGGFMMIGLYSEIARRPVIAGREYIAQQNIPNTAEGIRALRQHVRSLPADHPIKNVMDTQDFYALSECRDLLFHVQEHRFTALELQKCIDTLGLRFLGFQGPPAPSVMAHYKATHPDDPFALDLNHWHQYELQNPTIFKGMYQFWLQKPAG